MKITKGTKIYYGGDMANLEGFGTITDVIYTSHGTTYVIQMEDSRIIKVPNYCFSNEYKGHGGTRFVTKEAYENYRNAIYNKYYAKYK